MTETTPKRRRKPTLARMQREAVKAGLTVTRVEYKPDGTVTFHTSTPQAIEGHNPEWDTNPWDTPTKPDKPKKQREVPTHADFNWAEWKAACIEAGIIDETGNFDHEKYRLLKGLDKRSMEYQQRAGDTREVYLAMLDMLDRKPTRVTIRHTLAAMMIVAPDPTGEAWREVSRRLRNQYGEVLSVTQVRAEIGLE